MTDRRLRAESREVHQETERSSPRKESKREVKRSWLKECYSYYDKIIRFIITSNNIPPIEHHHCLGALHCLNRGQKARKKKGIQ